MADHALFPPLPAPQPSGTISPMPTKPPKILNWAEEKEEEEEWEMLTRKQIETDQVKDQLITTLNNELREKNARIKELERQMEDLSRKIGSGSAPELVAVNDMAVSGTSTASIHSADTADTSLTSGPESAPDVSSSSGDQLQAVSPSSPTSVNSPLAGVTSPHATPWGRPPREIPPPPPAPKVRLPIDIARERIAAGQAKAAGKKEVPPVLVALAAKGGWSGSGKQLDLRDMSLEERSALFCGSTISIYVGQDAVRGVPKKLFMTASSKANDYFSKYPQLNSIHFKAGEISVPALKWIVEWLTNMGSYGKVYSIPLTGNLAKDVAIMRTARMFAMERYVAHFTRKYCDYIRNNNPTHDDITVIIKAATPGDPLLDCLANNLAHQRYRGNIPDREAFEKVLEKYPAFTKCLDEIEVKLAANRGSRGRTGSPMDNSITPESTSSKAGKHGIGIHEVKGMEHKARVMARSGGLPGEI